MVISIVRSKKFKSIFFSLAILFCHTGETKAQFSIRDTTLSFPMIGIVTSYQLPGGDLADRFGNNLNVGAVFQWKFRNNILIGLEGNFLFGENVKENSFLDAFKTPDGNIIDGNGQYAIVALRERGFKFEIKTGKIFPIIGPNKNSGLMTTLGVGFIQHKIRIETPSGNIPYLEGEYKKGFDRLTNGLSLTEFLGYMNFSNHKLVNFYAGIECTQGFTKNKRAQNFDTGIQDTKSRTDLLFGIRLGWVFPIYKRMSDKTYIN